jgi:hypothetical protein
MPPSSLVSAMTAARGLLVHEGSCMKVKGFMPRPRSAA